MEEPAFNYSYRTKDGIRHPFGSRIGTIEDADAFAPIEILALVKSDLSAVCVRFDGTCGEPPHPQWEGLSGAFSVNKLAFYYDENGDWQEMECNPESLEDAFTCFFDARSEEGGQL